MKNTINAVISNDLKPEITISSTLDEFTAKGFTDKFINLFESIYDKEEKQVLEFLNERELSTLKNKQNFNLLDEYQTNMTVFQNNLEKASDIMVDEFWQETRKNIPCPKSIQNLKKEKIISLRNLDKYGMNYKKKKMQSVKKVVVEEVKLEKIKEEDENLSDKRSLSSEVMNKLYKKPKFKAMNLKQIRKHYCFGEKYSNKLFKKQKSTGNSYQLVKDGTFYKSKKSFSGSIYQKPNDNIIVNKTILDELENVKKERVVNSITSNDRSLQNVLLNRKIKNFQEICKSSKSSKFQNDISHSLSFIPLGLKNAPMTNDPTIFFNIDSESHQIEGSESKDIVVDTRAIGSYVVKPNPNKKVLNFSSFKHKDTFESDGFLSKMWKQQNNQVKTDKNMFRESHKESINLDSLNEIIQKKNVNKN
jgi:hypothetical protein